MKDIEKFYLTLTGYSWPNTHTHPHTQNTNACHSPYTHTPQKADVSSQFHSFCMTIAASYLCAFYHNWFILMMYALDKISPFINDLSIYSNIVSLHSNITQILCKNYYFISLQEIITLWDYPFLFKYSQLSILEERVHFYTAYCCISRTKECEWYSVSVQYIPKNK